MRPIALLRVQLPYINGLVVSLALGLPALAEAKPGSPEQTVTAAKKSPLFRRELRRSEITKAGLMTITISPGVDMDFPRYVRESALDRRPELAALFDSKLPSGFLARKPSVEETILELEDRIVVDRTMTVELTDGACAKTSRPKVITELCFVKNPKNKPDKAVSAELLQLRAQARKHPTRVFHGKIRGSQIATMNDDQLLDLMLNTAERTIRHVSVVPRRTVAAGSSLGKFGVQLEPMKMAAELSPAPSGSTSSPSGPNVKSSAALGTQQRQFDTEYFVTGFTIGKQIEDTLEYEIAKKRWWHARYYVQFDYSVDAAFGVRVPFSVDVVATGEGDTRNVAVSVKPIEVDANGSPAYSAVNLPKNQYHGGREFVFHVKAECKLSGRIPGKSFDTSCTKKPLGFDEGRKIKPVLGSEESKITSWWIPGDKTGLKLSLGQVSASLDLGIGAVATKGRIGMHASALPSSGVSGLQNGNLSFTNRNPIDFTVTRNQSTPNAGFRLSKPTYGFDLKLRPEVRGKIVVDVAIYSKSWVVGPYALDFLSIPVSFTLDHHKGTVAQHDYRVFQTQGMPQASNATMQAKPTKTQAPKPKPSKSSVSTSNKPLGTVLMK